MIKLPASADNLSKRQREIVSLFIEDGLPAGRIADQLGCSIGNVYAILRRDDVKEVVLQATRSAISLASFAAAQRLASLSSDAKSEFVQLEASKALLDRAGVSQPVETQPALAIQINLNNQ